MRVASGWATVSLQTQWTWRAATPVMRGETDCSFGNSAWARKADRAFPPSKWSRCFGVGDMRCGLAEGEWGIGTGVDRIQDFRACCLAGGLCRVGACAVC